MSLTIDDIRAAEQRIKGVAVNTPLVTSRYLNELLDAKVYIKLENLQQIGAFKFRGAYNRLCQLNEEEKKRGVVAFSSGNHAQGIALAAKMLNMKATIVMPSDAPKLKLEGTLRLGAKVVEYDRSTESREDIAVGIAKSVGSILVPAFEDYSIMAGQGTIGIEVADQLRAKKKKLDAYLAPAGGGGLLAGTSVAIRSLIPGAKVYGVEQEGYDDHALSRKAGRRIKIKPQKSTMCDALMATTPGKMTWSINSKTATDFLVVNEDEIAHAVAFAFLRLKVVVEPGGAVALASLLEKRIELAGKTIVIVLSGGNIDGNTFRYCLEKFPNPM
ncbi:MAG: threonine/serine dehydratase [Gammaproteobacteria bacterium]|nr:threonine/serine dehydratase [Gammaproteobacteria bacterium]